MGSFRLELNTKTANYENDNWTLSVDTTDYGSWLMTADNGMLVFRKKRNLTQCPPTGAYTVICNRCKGSIVGTLSSERVYIQGRDAGDIDNGDFNTTVTNLTDFGNVPVGTSREYEYVIKNNRPSQLHLTGNPIVSIGGANASQFTVTQSLPSVIAPYSYNIFAIKFTPTTTGEIDAGVRIVNDSTDENPYIFNLKGTGVPNQQSATNSGDGAEKTQEPPGIVFPADAVGTIYQSTDGGSNWSSKTLDIRTGQYATCTYDYRSDALYVFYVTDDMLFVRRYPSFFYTDQESTDRQLDPAFDGFNIVKPPEIIIPNINDWLNNAIGLAAGGGVMGTLTGLGNLNIFFSLPNLKTPGEVVDTYEQDLRSKKTQLINEKDPGGLPIFLVGNREGALINGVYPYPSTYVFNTNTSVARTKPAACVMVTGGVRFYYVDLNGNINGGMLNSDSPIIDIKRRAL
jgi:hypothetical protein